MCSNCSGDYENPDATLPAEDLEFSDYGREGSHVVKLGVWIALLAFCGAAWGFSIAWIYPVIYKLLQ